MGAITAELRVAEHRFPVLSCAYGLSQDTDVLSRPSAQVDYAPLEATFDLDHNDFLAAWAESDTKAYPVDLTLIDADGGHVLKTVHMAAAQCVRYERRFQVGNTAGGSHQLFIALSDPAGFTTHAGGPGAFLAPAARDHGRPEPEVPGGDYYDNITGRFLGSSPPVNDIARLIDKDKYTELQKKFGASTPNERNTALNQASKIIVIDEAKIQADMQAVRVSSMAERREHSVYIGLDIVKSTITTYEGPTGVNGETV